MLQVWRFGSPLVTACVCQAFFMVLYTHSEKLLGSICLYIFPAIPCFLPIRQLGRPSLLLQGRKNQQNIDNRGVIFLAVESQVPGSKHKPEIWEIRWKAGKLSPDQIRLFKLGKKESQRSQESWYDVRSLRRTLHTSHLPCSPPVSGGQDLAIGRTEMQNQMVLCPPLGLDDNILIWLRLFS